MIRFSRIVLAVAFIAAVAVYTVFMIFALPGLLKPYLERKAGEAVGGEAHIGAIEVRPFELSLTVRDFSVANGTAKLTWDSIYVNMRLSSIFTRSISLDELRIHDLHFVYTLQHRKEGEFSAMQFFTEAFLSRTNMPVNINRFIIQNGALEIFDKRTENVRQFSVAPISFSLENFSTQYSAGKGNNYNLQFSGLNGGFFHWNGSLQWAPFLSEGKMEIRGLDVLQLRDFYQERLPFVLQSGVLDLRTRYRVVEKPEFGLALENTELVLNKPSMLADSSRFSMRATSLRVDSLQLSTLNRTLFASNVTLDSANAHYSLNKIPKPDHRIFEFMGYNANTPDAVDANANVFGVFLKKIANLPRWQIKIDSIKTRQAEMKIVDSISTPATEHSLNDVQLFFANVTNNASDNASVDGSALLDSGKLNIKGTVNLFPLQVSGNWDVKKFPLTLLHSPLQGQLAARLNMLWNPDSLLFTGDAEVDTLLLRENNKEFLRIQQLTAKGLNFMFMPVSNWQIADVNVQSPVMYLAWSEKKQKSKQQSSFSKLSPFIINQINFNKGTLHIKDEDPSTPFSYRVNLMHGSLRNLSNQRRNANLTVRGKMGGYAPFYLGGFINLSGRYPKVKFALEAANQDLVILSPYSAKYAGYRIAKGQIALKVDYDIENNKMQADNHIVIHDFTFGEEVQSEEATNLPVRLGTTLLTDKDGVIDLDVAISGDLDDPEFSVGGLIWKVIKNLLGKAAAAPLRSLMALVDSNSDPEIIVFAPGSEQLNRTQIDFLKQLAQALAQRPQLQLDIYGNADSTLDGNTKDAMRALANARAQNIKMELLNINASLGERVFVVSDGNFSEHTANIKIRQKY